MPERTDISRVVSVARSAGLLHARRRFVTIAGWAAVWSLALALIGVLIVRLTIGPAWWWAIPAGALAMGMTLSAVLVARSRWTLGHAAGEIDLAHGTDGALRTALEIRDSDGDSSLVALARSRGAEAAGRMDPSRASASANVRGWWWALPLAFGSAAAGLLVMPVARGVTPADTAPAVQRAIEGIESASAEAAQIEPATLPDPDAWNERFEEIEALEEELRRGEGGADAPARAAAALQEAADELDRQTEQAAREEQRLRELAEAFDSAEDAGRADTSALVDRLADALARNDMLDAEQAARAIDEAQPTMSEADRRALAETLEDLADRLEPEAYVPPETFAEAETGSAADPEPTAPGERNADQAPQDTPTEQPDETPAGAANEPDANERDASQPDTKPDQSREQDQGREGSLSEALRDRAESLREQDEQPAPDDAGAEPGRQDQPDGQDAAQGEEPGQESGRQGAQQDRQEPGQQPSQREGQQPGESPGTQPQPQSQPRPQPQPGTDSADPSQPRESQPTGSETPSETEPGQTTPDSQAGDPSADPRSEPQPQNRPDGQPGSGSSGSGEPPGGQTDPMDQSGQGEPVEGQGGTGQERRGEGVGEGEPGQVERAVRRMREQQGAREQNQRVAESLRERARDLVDNDPNNDPNDDGTGGRDPSMGDGLGESRGGVGDGLSDRGLTDEQRSDPSRFEPVDASGGPAPEGDPGRVVGDWFDPDRQELPASEREAAASELKRAARRARDAVDNQQVPRRYRDLVRKVFDRVENRAEEVAPQGPAAPGQDAKPSTGSGS